MTTAHDAMDPLNGRMAIRQQISCQITMLPIWIKLVKWPNGNSKTKEPFDQPQWPNSNSATVLSPNCHSAVQTQAQTQTEPKAYIVHLNILWRNN